MSLSDACELLGVSTSTLRRWADTGVLRTFVTPGGHRRVARASVEALLPPGPGERPPLSAMGATTGRVSRHVRRSVMGGHARLPWVDAIDESSREQFREHGRAIVRALLRALDEPDDAARGESLREATEACTAYGREAGAQGIPISVTTDLFLRFRRPFLEELSDVARRRELGMAATAEMMSVATHALDELLIATLRGWEEARAAGGGRPAHRAARCRQAPVRRPLCAVRVHARPEASR